MSLCYLTYLDGSNIPVSMSISPPTSSCKCWADPNWPLDAAAALDCFLLRYKRMDVNINTGNEIKYIHNLEWNLIS